MKKLSANWKTTEPFSGKLALEVQEISTSELESKLKEYRALFPKITPSLETAKSVLLALAIRSFSKSELDYIVCANESHEQLARHLGLDQSDSKTNGKSAIANALRFLEWVGLLRTLRKGGGKLKKPTVREVIPYALSKRVITRSESDLSEVLDGKDPDLDGKALERVGNKPDLNGKDSELIGSEPVTPSTYQVLTKQLPDINHESEKEFSDDEYKQELENAKNFAFEQARKTFRRPT